MAHVTADFVKETSTTTGLGPIVLGGARAPAQTFSAVCANGDTVHYAISHDTLNQWETGVGTYSSGGNSITRTTVLSSSNGGAAVNLSAGTKRVDLVEPAARIVQQVGPVQIGATSFGSGSLSFSNANGVSWGLSTNSAGGTITASVGAAGATSFANANNVSFGLAGSTITASASFPAATSLSFSNLNGVTFGIAGSTLTASSPIRFELANLLGASLSDLTANTSFIATRVQWPGNTALTSAYSTQNVFFALNSAGAFQQIAAAAWVRVSANNTVDAQNISFSNANGISFSVVSSTVADRGLVAVVNASALPQLGLVSHVGGNSVAGVTRIAFSNGSNVTWSLSTAASAVTVFGSVAAGGGGGAGATFSLAGASSMSSITAFTDSTLTSPTINLPLLGTVNDTNISLANMAFRITSDSIYGAAWMHFINPAGGFFSAQGFQLRNTNGNSWVFATSTSAGSGRYVIADLRAAVAVSAGTTFQFMQDMRFLDSNNVSFGANGVSITASASFPAATSLSFSNLNGVTFGIVGSTLTASVAAGGGGGIAASAAGSSQSAGTVVWSNSNNVSFGMNGSTITASASFAQSAQPALTVSAAGSSVSAGSLVFSNSNGFSFGMAGSTITGAAPEMIGLVSGGGATAGDVTRLVFDNAFNVNWLVISGPGIATVQASAVGGGFTYGGYSPHNEANLIATAGWGQGSLFFQPLQLPNVAFDRLLIPFFYSNNTVSSATLSLTFRAGIYTRGTGASSSLISLMSTASFSTAQTLTASSQAVASFHGDRFATLGLTGTLSASDYWIGIISSSTFSSGAHSFSNRVFSQILANYSGIFGVASNRSAQSSLGAGFYSAGTTTFPGSVAFSQIDGTNMNARQLPAFAFALGTV